MSPRTLRILLVEDDPDDYLLTRTLVDRVDRCRIELVWARTFDEAVAAAAARHDLDAILTDYRLGARTGIELLAAVAEAGCDLPVIVLTGQGDLEVDLLAMEHGAADYLVKADLTAPLLERSLRYARERHRLMRELRAMSLVDELTGLYNRRGFFTFAEPQRRLAERRRAGMLLFFVDLDGMKEINDGLGHAAGDAALAETASLLRETFRDTDILARVGGDEFVVLALEVSAADGVAIQQRLEERLERRNDRTDRRFTLAPSVGVARFEPGSGESIDGLLSRGDSAMYAVKQARRLAAVG